MVTELVSESDVFSFSGWSYSGISNCRCLYFLNSYLLIFRKWGTSKSGDWSYWAIGTIGLWGLLGLLDHRGHYLKARHEVFAVASCSVVEFCLLCCWRLLCQGSQSLETRPIWETCSIPRDLCTWLVTLEDHLATFECKLSISLRF